MGRFLLVLFVVATVVDTVTAIVYNSCGRDVVLCESCFGKYLKVPNRGRQNPISY